jgi:hypothetical protein
MKSDREAAVVVGSSESDLIVEDKVAIVCADDEIRKRAAGLLLLDCTEYAEGFSIACCYHEIPPPNR